MMQRHVQVLNETGLHARPAAEFVRCAQRFGSSITIHKDGETYCAGSILDVLTANLDCGSSITLEAEGPDAEVALEELTKLLERFKLQEHA